jgi:hypothetical protein
MDMEDPVAEEVKEEGETITMGISEYDFLCNELLDLQFELIAQRWEAREDKLRAKQRFEPQQELLRSILSQLPPAPGASSLLLHHSDCLGTLIPYIVLFFSIHTLRTMCDLSLRVCKHLAPCLLQKGVSEKF